MAKLAKTDYRKRNAFIFAACSCLLLCAIYAISPLVAGVFEIGDRLGPRIYPRAYHELLYMVGWDLADHDAAKPRVPFNQKINRPWFYSFATSNSTSEIEPVSPNDVSP